MSSQARGFVRNERFGAGQVIPGTNRANTRKWLALGLPIMTNRLVRVRECQKCGAINSAETCCECARLPGHSLAPWLVGLNRLRQLQGFE